MKQTERYTIMSEGKRPVKIEKAEEIRIPKTAGDRRVPNDSGFDGVREESESELEVEEEFEEFVSSRPHKVRKKKHYLLRFVCCIAIIGSIYYILTSEIFEIRTIKVSGVSHYSTEQVIEMTGISQGLNMFKLKAADIESGLEADPYIKNAVLKRKPLHDIEIEIDERKEKFAVINENKYIIVDFEGTVLSIVEEPPTLTVVQNIEVTEANPGEVIKVKSDVILSETISFLEKVEEGGMYFKTVEASNFNVKAYLNDLLLCKGRYRDMGNNISEVKKVVHDLGQKKITRGSILVTGNGTCTFSPEV